MAAMTLFQRFLSVWILLAMGVGILIGSFAPKVREFFDQATIAQVSIPIAILLWGMILPMMLQIDFRSIVNVLKQPKPVLLTSAINYAVAPFTMYAISLLFFNVAFIGYLGHEKAQSYIIGAVLLGGAPCTAMVFVWSALMRGNPAYTVAQVALNDIILLITYVPTVKLLAHTSNISMPWDTLLYSVAFFVFVPLVVGIITRQVLARNEKSFNWLNTKLIPTLDNCAMVFLVLMVILIFISQAATITDNLLDILIIAIPLLLQTFFIWGITYALCLWARIPFDIAGPASLIACSNFFEMAVAIAVAIYGSSSGAALATVVGVLIEVPVMLALVSINNRTKHLFDKRSIPTKQSLDV